MKRSDVASLAILAAIFGFVLGYIAAAKLESEIAKDGWDIASAVGTVGAVVVALWLGLQTMLQQRVEKSRASEIAGMLMLVQLQQFNGEVELLARFLPQYNEADPLHIDNEYLATARFEALMSPLLKLTPSELSTLMELSPEVGINLALGLAQLRALEDRHGMLARRGMWADLKPETRKRTNGRWATQAEAGSLHVKLALSHLKTQVDRTRRIHDV